MICTHGMPSPASCVDCMDEGPVAPLATTVRTATHRIEAQYHGRCAADARHAVEPGDELGMVVDVGWCCYRCIV